MFECPALQHLRDKYSPRFSGSGQTMQQFLWQSEIVGVVYYVRDSWCCWLMVKVVIGPLISPDVAGTDVRVLHSFKVVGTETHNLVMSCHMVPMAPHFRRQTKARKTQIRPSSYSKVHFGIGCIQVQASSSQISSTVL